MKLSQLIQNIDIIEVKGGLEHEVSSLYLNSHGVKAGGLFFAVKGNLVDGHDFIDQAIQTGATTIVCETFPEEIHEHVSYVQVVRVQSVVGPIASTFYQHPSLSLKLVGITGTNGKTTVATLLHQLFQKLGYTAGLISTVENKIAENAVSADMTTPDAVTLHRLFAEMLEAGCTHAFMEVSSHALEQGRVQGVDFAGAVFMNVTLDHLDYHGTFENYLNAKKKLFDQLSPAAFALANLDDENGEFMFQATQAAKYYYGLHREDDAFTGKLQFEGEILANTFHGLKMKMNTQEFESGLIGRFNAYNVLAVYGTAVLLEEDSENILKAMQTFTPPAGRFQHMEINGKVGIVDYAHTPDALENVLQTIHNIKSENQKVFTVIGCGGDRDKSKRGPMATIAQKYSDIALFTSDNPRSEDPRAIIEDMMKHIGSEDPESDNVYKVVDRRDAIGQAVERAGDGDIILVAGKGHETYQEIKGVRHLFDDVEVLREEMEE